MNHQRLLFKIFVFFMVFTTTNARAQQTDLATIRNLIFTTNKKQTDNPKDTVKLGHHYSAKDEERKTAYLKALLGMPPSSLQNDLVGINVGSVGFMLRALFHYLLVMEYIAPWCKSDNGDFSYPKFLTLLAGTVVLDSSLGHWLYNKLVTENGDTNDYKDHIVAIGGTPGAALYGLYNKCIGSNKAGLYAVITGFNARQRDFPLWAQDILEELSENLKTMTKDEIKNATQELLVEINKKQAEGFKEPIA